MIIYKATNIINGKSYIGQTKKTLNERKGEHNCNYKYYKSYFYNAIKKYGKNNFEGEILYKGIETRSQANLGEMYFIRVYNTNNKEFGYNTSLGGDGTPGIEGTEDRKEKLRRKRVGSKNPMGGKVGLVGNKNPMGGKTKEKNPFWGKSHTEETKNKISKKSKNGGKSLSEDELTKYKKNMSKSIKGKKVSKETREKLSELNKGSKNPMWGKSPWNKGQKLKKLTKDERLNKSKYKWYIYDIINNEEYIISDLKSGCEIHNINRTNIYRNANTNKLFNKKYLIVREQK